MGIAELTAAISLVEAASALYVKLRAQAGEKGEMTPDELATLDARAAAIFASPEAQPSDGVEK